METQVISVHLHATPTGDRKNLGKLLFRYSALAGSFPHADCLSAPPPQVSYLQETEGCPGSFVHSDITLCLCGSPIILMFEKVWTQNWPMSMSFFLNSSNLVLIFLDLDLRQNLVNEFATKSQFDILSPIIFTGSASTQGEGIIQGVHTKVWEFGGPFQNSAHYNKQRKNKLVLQFLY